MLNTEKDARIPPKRHNHHPGEKCLGCIRDGAVDAGRAFEAGLERGAETLATARRVSNIYQNRTKDMAAVLLDARGLVRGIDAALDGRIDSVLKAGGFLDARVTPPEVPHA